MSQQDPPKRKRLPAPERRKKILAAAQEVFIARGFSGARTKEIAEGAGVTEAFLYRHFDSKEELYAAAVLDPLREGLEGLAADVQRLHDEHTEPLPFIRALNTRCLAFYADFAALQTTALYSELARGREFYASSVRPLLDPIGELIANRVGWMRQDLDPKTVRQAVLGSLWAIGLDITLRHGSRDVDAAARLTEMFTGGIKEKAVPARS